MKFKKRDGRDTKLRQCQAEPVRNRRKRSSQGAELDRRFLVKKKESKDAADPHTFTARLRRKYGLHFAKLCGIKYKIPQTNKVKTQLS